MKLPISKRLALCASLVPPGQPVADVGCDHGYLGIHLLTEGRVPFVQASDLNEMPLESARRNAARFGVADKMSFSCAGGLDAVSPGSVATVVCAGMGGDLIRKIVEAAPWVMDPAYTLILQPQSGVADFRKWVFQQGFSVLEEHPVLEDGHMYFAMKLRWTGERFSPTPGQHFVTPQMLRSESADLPAYLDGMIASLSRSIDGMRLSEHAGEKLEFYLKARDEIMEMRDSLDHGR